jgi:hypothetical protein
MLDGQSEAIFITTDRLAERMRKLGGDGDSQAVIARSASDEAIQFRVLEVGLLRLRRNDVNRPFATI